MNDIARLQIRVQSLEAELADRRLRDLEKSGTRAEKATDGLTNSFKRFIGPAAIAAGVITGITKLTGVTREFDILNAQLITATGSAENAGVAFEAIQDFATNTPYDLQQVTDGFTKLVNLGLTPSERALTSYGDTASAMGKDLSQLIEAVADAATGEFERLKEFGIRAKSEGDNVSFTFRGVTTTVKKNAEEIEGYLIGLGENNFAGAMAQRMDSLDGALSNLSDSWNKLWLDVSNLGVGNLIEEAVRTATAALEELSAQINSGQLMANIEGIGIAFDGTITDIENALRFLADTYTAVMNYLSEVTGITAEGILSKFDTNLSHLPQNIRALIQLAAVEVATFVDYGAEYGQAFAEVLGSEIAKFVQKAGAYGSEIADALNPFDGDTFDLEANLRALDAVAADMAEESFKRAEEQVAISRAARMASIEAILAERDTSIKASDDQYKKAEELRAEYDRLAEARKKADGDRLARFSQGATGGTGGVNKELVKLEQDLRTEEEKIAESYQRRLDLILTNTEEGSVKQADLIRRLNEQFSDDVLGEFKEPDTHEEQIAALEEFYEKRRELILSNTQLTEEERTKLEEELTKNRNERLQALEATRTSLILNSSADLFDSLAGLAKTFAGEQSSTYKALFAVSKAFAIADSIIKIQQGIANAASQPFPANLAAMGSVVAATGSIISTIESTKLAGIAHGGLDEVPEEATYFLNKGERVLSPKQNRDLTDFLQERKDSSTSAENIIQFPSSRQQLQFKIEVINQLSNTPIEATAEMSDDETLRIFINAAEQKLSQDLQEGRGVWRTAQQKYGWSTKGTL